MTTTVPSGLTLGGLLKIVSNGLVYNNLPELSVIWDYVQTKSVKAPQGRQENYSMRKSYGPAAAQFMALTGGAFPAAQAGQTVEATATPKKFAFPIEVNNTVIELAESDAVRYGDPIAEELEAKGLAMAQVLSGAIYRDGSGVIGTILTCDAPADGRMWVNLNTTSSARGSINFFLQDDVIKCVTTAGAAQDVTVSSGSISYYKVMDINRVSDKFQVAAFTSADAELSISAANQWGATDFIIRRDVTACDTTAISASTELNTLTEEWAGLEALTATSGTVHNVSLGGAIKGNRFSCSSALIDQSHFQSLLTQLFPYIGRYQYDAAFMAPEVYQVLVESREANRMFTDAVDGVKGVKKLAYQDGEQLVVFKRDNMCPKTRIWLPPKKGVLAYHGTKFEPVRAAGSKTGFSLKPASGGGFTDTSVAYFSGRGYLAVNHPSAIGVLTDFVIA